MTIQFPIRLLLMFSPLAVMAQAVPMAVEHWKVRAETSESVRMDQQNRWQDTPSLQIHQATRQSNNLTRPFTVEPHRIYRMTATVKLNNPYYFGPGFSGFVIRVVDSDGREYGSTEPMTAIRDWSDFSFDFASDEAKTLTLQIYTHKSIGTVWIGAIDITEISADSIGDVTPEDATVVLPSRQECERGYILFHTSPLEQCSSRRRPACDERLETVRIAAARGEYENAALGVFALEPQELTALYSGGTLAGPGGAIIPAENISIRMLAPFPFALDALNSVDLPFLLESCRPIKLDSDRSQRYFVTVKIPETAPAGIYHGKLELAMMERETEEIALEVTVRDFDLAESGMAYFIYLTTPPEEREIRDLAEHGMTTVTLYDPGHIEEGNLISGFEQLCRWAQESGLYHPEHPLIYLNVHQPEWIADITPPPATVNALLQQARNLKVTAPLIYCLDEPMDAAIATARQAVAQLKAGAPEAQAVSALDLNALKQGLIDTYDAVIFTDMDMGPEILQLKQERPDKLWYLYDCFQNGKNPLVDRYMYGVYLFASGFDGFGQWCYSDPKRKEESRTRIYYGYVHKEQDELIPTTGYEAKREGIDDMRYIRTLQQAMKEAQHDPAQAANIAAGESLLEEIRQSIRLESFRERLLIQTGTEYRRDNKPQPDITPERLELWRWQMAELITRLTANGSERGNKISRLL